MVFKFSQTCIKNDSKYVLIIYFFCFSGCRVVSNFVTSLNESCKTYLGPKLPPGANVIKLFTAVVYKFL
jgi:hypothetical protein